jgi:FkbM family methyltransferase
VTQDLLVNSFELLYRRPPTEEEAARLRALEIFDLPEPQHVMRRIIAASDRNIISTPFLIRFGRDDIVWKVDDGFELALDAADIAVSRYVSAGVYEPHLKSFFKRMVRPGMTVADVGANIGYYSMLSANLVGPTGRVFSFEPNSENSRLILMSKERNRADNLYLYPVALSDHAGHAFFSTALGSNGGFLSETLDALMSPQCVVVPTVRMDDIISNQIDFIKMDVEGAEGLVLAGARQLISKYRPIITMEFSPEMLSRVSRVNPLELLKDIECLGYSINMLDRVDGGDALFSIDDVADFVNGYGSAIRIEDLVFLPKL